MTGKIYITDVIGQDTALLDVVRQVKSQKNATEFLAIIDSVGGYVEEGFAIYDYLKGLGVPVHTYAKKAYSIASVIFMAGQRRIVDENATEVLMIHLPWMQVAGSYDQISTDIEELKAAEKRLVNFYSQQIDISPETVHALLSNETFLSSTEALDLGLVTETKALAPAMALLQENNKDDKSDNWMNKAEKILNRIAKNLGIKAELLLQDATGLELVFPDLNEGESPAEGDKATVEGKPAEGDFLMADGITTMTFEGGVLSSITIDEASKEGDDESENADADDTNPEGDDIQADDKDIRIAELEAENADLKAKIEELEAAAKPDETQDKLLSIIEASTKKIVELEKNYKALAQSIGSDFTPDTKKETNPTVKASAEQKSRAWQILNA